MPDENGKKPEAPEGTTYEIPKDIETVILNEDKEPAAQEQPAGEESPETAGDGSVNE